MSVEDWTRNQCAEHWGISPSTWSGYVVRGHAPQPYTHVGRTPLWDADTVQGYPRPGQGARTDLVMPEELPVVYQTTTGTRGGGLYEDDVPPVPRKWHVSVADRAARDDTHLTVVAPDGHAVASITWDGRLSEGDEELDDAVQWIVAAARKIQDVALKLASGTPPAALWAEVADAWKFAGRGAYFAWAREAAENVNATAEL